MNPIIDLIREYPYGPIVQKIIGQIQDKNHFFVQSFESNGHYHISGLMHLWRLSQKLNKEEFSDLIENKLLLTKRFDKHQYIQGVAEVTITGYFADLVASGEFKYEPRLNPDSDKNPEFQIHAHGFKYNFEVKCAHYGKEEAGAAGPGLRIGVMGRHPERDGVLSILKDSLKESAPEINVSLKKHYGLNMLDYLKLAHGKFPDEIAENEVNILIVCTDHQMDQWNALLHGYQGLLTKGTQQNIQDYNKIDIVAVSNLYHSHSNYLTKPYLKPFEFDQNFNIYHVSQFRRAMKEASIRYFHNIFPQLNIEVKNYLKEFQRPDLHGVNDINKEFIIALYNEDVLNKIGRSRF